MSAEAFAIALNHSRAKGAVKLVLIGIANHDGDGGSWPSIDTLARYSAQTERGVQLAIVKLEQLGEVSRRINAGGNRDTPDSSRPNLYEFTLKCPPLCDGTKHHRLLCRVCLEALPASRRRIGVHALCAHLDTSLGLHRQDVVEGASTAAQAVSEALEAPSTPVDLSLIHI